jgi:flavin reductase (DIM6/NTAB) family NADH-FMN oxidoreductase RutF
VAPPLIHECPVQMEGIVHDFRPFGKNVSANVFEVHIVKLHVAAIRALTSIRCAGVH